jgi:phytoene dehydrogenase-like protein
MRHRPTVSRSRDVVVIGAGHNGLVAACYLARAGLDVEVVEADTVPGGAVSTVQRWPGVRVDRGSSIHVMVRHTTIATELTLADVGLAYDDVEPWGVLPHPAGPIRFSADLTETCTSIEAACGSRDADAYHRFVTEWTPRMQAFLAAAEAPATMRGLARSMGRLYRRHPRGWASTTHAFLEPAQALLDRTFAADPLRAALGWWAAQSGPPPHEPGTAPMAGTVALLHLRSPGRPRGGSGELTQALVRRFEALGGTLRLDDAAVRIDPDRRTVRTASGDAVTARAVLGACHVEETMRLLGADSARPRVRTGRGVGVALRLLTSGLPAYTVDVAGAHTAMQLLVREPAQLRAAYGDLLRGEPAADPPMLVMTPTAVDPTLAPPGRHVVTVWAQWHPHRLRTGSWQTRREVVADGLLDRLDSWAPGFSATVIDRLLQTPPDLERELGLVAGNVMHVEPGLDAMFGLRPAPDWSGYRTPYAGLYLCGASTHPGGGVWGASGRNAARVVARDLTPARWRSRGTGSG